MFLSPQILTATLGRFVVSSLPPYEALPSLWTRLRLVAEAAWGEVVAGPAGEAGGLETPAPFVSGSVDLSQHT